MKYLAHENQSLESHLEGVAEICKTNSAKIGMGEYGELLGLLHDLGKYSTSFQEYIKSALGVLNPDEDEGYVDSRQLKGRIDHSSAGAQMIWRQLSGRCDSKGVLGQVLSLCLASHHSGLIDCLASDFEGTEETFIRRMAKSDTNTHLAECATRLEQRIKQRIRDLYEHAEFTKPFEQMLGNIMARSPQKNAQTMVVQFQLGLLVRFLFSCLIDADRQDTCDAENKSAAKYRQSGQNHDWGTLKNRFEKHLNRLKPQYDIDIIRQTISRCCLNSAMRNPGLFTLTVPTGGGKTLASLRFALHHAHKHNMHRIIYVIPYTSIIDQNANVVRDILEPAGKAQGCGSIVIEHHSNVGAEKQSWKEKMLAESWDAPIIYTTMVQFLETMFGAGTRGARRMHRLSKSVVIFDEIQTLPVKCVHMFCNAINFLVDQCGSSVVLCTATQPLLGAVNKTKGALSLSDTNEIVPDTEKLFADLKRVEVIDSYKPSGWTEQEITDLVLNEVSKAKSCLIVVNMKKSARSIFKKLEDTASGVDIYHLSTSMCPAHRKMVLDAIRIKLVNKLPVICVSTQLIEAGVDIDFGSVIRFAAGLDSIAQAAGRCNRNGAQKKGNVYVVNPVDENLDFLKDISIGRDKTARVFRDYNDAPGKYDHDRISPKMLTWYYKNYFFDRADQMAYPVTAKLIGRDDTLLHMLSANKNAVADYERTRKKKPEGYLRHSFMTASKAFQSIDAPTESVIVQFKDEGKMIVNQLCSSFEVEKQFKILREAQQYSVNLFPHEFKKLQDAEVLSPVQKETSIYYLTDNRYYSKDFGIVMEPVEKYEEGLINA